MEGAERTLAGRYALSAVIGRGGMATVYRARDLVLDRTVAVKVLAPALSERDSSSATRFEREARVAAGLSHRGIVAIFDTSVDGPERFIVMEHVSGRTLASTLGGGRLPVAAALDITTQIADALASIHAAGLVHRDLKPSNIMIDREGGVKLLDFGIALAPEATALTQTHAVLGSASYIAPERVDGDRGGSGADVYSLGCVLYEMLDGAPPFAASDAVAVMHGHLHHAPAKLVTAPSLPAQLDALVMQMLAKRAEARPSAADVRARAAAILIGEAGDRPTLPIAAGAPLQAGQSARTLLHFRSPQPLSLRPRPRRLGLPSPLSLKRHPPSRQLLRIRLASLRLSWLEPRLARLPRRRLAPFARACLPPERSCRRLAPLAALVAAAGLTMAVVLGVTLSSGTGSGRSGAGAAAVGRSGAKAAQARARADRNKEPAAAGARSSSHGPSAAYAKARRQSSSDIASHPPSATAAEGAGAAHGPQPKSPTTLSLGAGVPRSHEGEPSVNGAAPAQHWSGAPGHGGLPPGHGGLPPGQQDVPPGQREVPPGQRGAG